MRDEDYTLLTRSDELPRRDQFNRLRRERPLAIIASLSAIAVGAGAMLTSLHQVETDNAYIQASRAPVSASVSGRIVEIRVHDNEHVSTGQTLFLLDPATAKAELSEADAALSVARARAQETKANYEAKMAAYRQSQDAVAFARTQNARQRLLQKEGLSAVQTLETGEHNIADAQLQSESARATASAALAAFGSDPNLSVEKFAKVRQAIARADGARMALEKTAIKALQAGTVTRVDQVQVGTYVNAGQPLFWMVSDQPYVEANFKESQLRDMRIGQEATVKVDAFPKVKLKARVASFSPGTGAVFSAIPAQNATGNWVKVVQRLTVRLDLINVPPDLPISAGLSARVSVDTRSRGTSS